jgi:hypothetical protein
LATQASHAVFQLGSQVFFREAEDRVKEASMKRFWRAAAASSRNARTMRRVPEFAQESHAPSRRCM